jgi:general secretion pathway protein G
MVIRQRDQRRHVRHGFTLMEILVVVAIIVILAGLGGYYFIGALEGAKKDKAILGAKTISLAVGVYYTEHSQWPGNLAVLVQRDGAGKGPYLKGETYLIDPWGVPYQYDANGPMNNTLEPDVWCVDPKTGQKLGNWMQSR